jgi:hypothetical protein
MSTLGAFAFHCNYEIEGGLLPSRGLCPEAETKVPYVSKGRS